MEEFHALHVQFSGIVQANFPSIDMEFNPNIPPPKANPVMALRVEISAWSPTRTEMLVCWSVLFHKAPPDYVLKYGVPYRNRTCRGGQSIAGHESDVVGSNSYRIT